MPLMDNPYVTIQERLNRHQLNKHGQYITYFKNEEKEPIMFDTKQEYDQYIKEQLSKHMADLINKLTPQQLYTLFGYGFERAFTGEYHDTIDAGDYICRNCGQKIFMSDHQFISPDGYTSFWGCIPLSLVMRPINGAEAVLCSNVYT